MRARLAPLGALALVTLYCHWFILTNDSPIWDGWFWLEWLKTRNWAPMREYTSAQGLPFHYWLFAVYGYLPNIVVTGMWVNFLCLLFESFVIYGLALRLAALPKGEALAVAALAQAIPVFSAAQDFPLIGLIAFRLLFLVSIGAATIAIETRGPRHWLWRGAALVGFYISCVTNGALLVLYGAVWLLFLFHYCRLEGLPPGTGGVRFIRRYPDLFLIPPAFYAARTFFIPQFGWYDDYNKPGANLPFLHEAFWSFFENVIPYHLQTTMGWFGEYAGATLVLGLGFIAWCATAPRHWATRCGSWSTAQYLGFGTAALCLAVLPMAAAGKFFQPAPIGEHSRHCMLTSVPVAILLLGVVRCGVFWNRKTPSRVLPAIVAGMILVFGSQYWGIYLGERVETIYSQSALSHIARDEEIRRSSIVLTASDVSMVAQRLYGIAAFTSVFGDQTRLVSHVPPRHRIGYLPADTELHTLSTSVLPSEFNRIDPGGQQVILTIARKTAGLSPAALASRDLRLRWLGSAEERDRFLSSLTEVAVRVQRPAQPFAPAVPPAPPAPAPASPREFVNSLGIPLVPIPGDLWVARYETTQAQFDTVMHHNPSLFRDPWRPVECVTWYDAVEFCRRLNESERATLPAGYSYRLPTGEEFDRFVADAWDKPAVIVGQKVTWRTEGVGTRPANALGLHDTVGNVWEWCLDWWEAEQRQKIAKGGSFSNEPDQLEPTAWKDVERSYHASQHGWLADAAHDRLLGRVRRSYPDQGFWNRGFRIVLAGPPPAALPPAVRTERPSQ